MFSANEYADTNYFRRRRLLGVRANCMEEKKASERFFAIPLVYYFEVFFP